MPWQNVALELAGLIGAAVAIMHGVLVQRLIVRPVVQGAVSSSFSPIVRRLIPPLIHFSTVAWFVGGMALAWATVLDPQARLAISVLVGCAYLFGAVGNFWATRGRHPGWMLLALALVLIVLGASAPALQIIQS